MKRIAFALLLLLAVKSFTQRPTDARLKGLDTFALKVLKDWNAAGVTIAVVEKQNSAKQKPFIASKGVSGFPVFSFHYYDSSYHRCFYSDEICEYC